ncbi:MAG TPA: GGDEF domain-containing protein [Candidatus Angelobacter sp.]|nr:GGDEF domain-containing protein [Candidatus Angelobacter sp.]
MSVNSKIFKILYRLALPGGLLLVFAIALIRLGLLTNSNSPLVLVVPPVIYFTGLLLSAYFRRSRLFFATLVLALSGSMLTWVAPRFPASVEEIMANAIALLLPLNLLVLVFVKERGIISRTGRRRLGVGGVQLIAVGALCLPFMKNVAALLERPFLPTELSDWSHLSQPALTCFIICTGIIMVPLIRRYRAVESSLFWAMICSFIALRSGVDNHLSGIFFATGELAILVALMETSYSMAYLDELTQLPSRRALNEALMKLPETYTIAMLDVDHFKKFNDSYGHESGDQALRLVGSKLARIAGGGKAYRYGGEEFTVVFPGKASDEVFVFLDRMRKIIEQSTFTVRGSERRGKRRVRTGKKQTNVTVSIGVASTSADQFTPSEVLRISDQALYKAKAKGRNCTVVVRTSGKSVRSVETGMKVLSVS